MHVVKTDLYGYFYVEGLERGLHEIYYLNTTNPTGMSKEEVRTQAYGEVKVATNNDKDIKFTNKYKITDATISNSNNKTNKTYEITLNTDGGTLSNTSLTITKNTRYGDIPTPEKTGYNFLGWYLNDKLVNSDVIVTSDNISEIKAKWSANSYTVTFNANGGSLDNSSNVTNTITFDTTLGTLPVVERYGYDFLGWYKSDGTNVTSETIYNDPDNIELEARWKAKEIECSAGTYLKGNEITCTTCEGGSYCTGGTYSFSSTDQGKSGCPADYWWSADGSSAASECYIITTAGKYIANAYYGEAPCVGGYYCPGGSAIYYGKTGGIAGCPSGYGTSAASSSAATQCYKTITISYSSNGGSGSTTASSCNAYYGTGSCSVTLRGNGFTRSGYTFQGWGTGTSAVTHSANTAYTFSSSLTLNAIWKATTYQPWGTTTYFAFGTPTTSSTTDYKSINYPVFAAMDAYGNKGICVRLQDSAATLNDEIDCFRIGDYSNEIVHLNNVVVNRTSATSSSCTLDKICSYRSRYCFIYGNNNVKCGNGYNSCVMYSTGVVNCT